MDLFLLGGVGEKASCSAPFGAAITGARCSVDLGRALRWLHADYRETNVLGIDMFAKAQFLGGRYRKTFLRGKVDEC